MVHVGAPFLDPPKQRPDSSAGENSPVLNMKENSVHFGALFGPPKEHPDSSALFISPVLKSERKYGPFWSPLFGTPEWIRRAL